MKTSVHHQPISVDTQLLRGYIQIGLFMGKTLALVQGLANLAKTSKRKREKDSRREVEYELTHIDILLLATLYFNQVALRLDDDDDDDEETDAVSTVKCVCVGMDLSAQVSL